MFIVLKDIDTINEYAKAGLLWWVNAADGGKGVTIETKPYTYRWKLDDSYVGWVGIHVEE